MTPPILLIELAERVEKSTGRDEALGHEILLACGWRKTCVGHFYGPLYYWSSPDGSKSYPEDQLPCPTESLDAAMTLRLDWMSIETCESAAPSSSPELKFTRCRVWDWRRGPLAIDPTNETKVEGNRPLPLNMCAAILRARAASENSHGR